MAEDIDLKQWEIFGIFPDKELSELAKITEKRAYKKRAHIYERGDRATHLFVVSKGLVSLRDIEPGDLVGISYEICEPGELFGTSCLMKPREHSLAAVCLEDSEVMAVEADTLLELCEKDPRLGYNLMLIIAQLYFDRYKHAKNQVYEMVKAPTIITALPG
jgi:CRP-like cAMP-binding protein